MDYNCIDEIGTHLKITVIPILTFFLDIMIALGIRGSIAVN